MKADMTESDFNPQAVKALVFDLDGTLLRPDKSLSGRTLRALRSCMGRGMRIILATGRSVDSGEVYRKRIGAEGPQVYYNGAEVVDMPQGRLIHTRFLDPEPILFCLNLARKTGLYFQVYFPAGSAAPDRELLMTERLTEEAELYRKNSGVAAVAGNLEEAIGNPGLPGLIKGMFIAGEEHHKGIRSLLEEKYGASVYVVRSSPVYLEILASGVSKGAGLLHALKYLKLSVEDAMAFGDEENDLPLFRTARFSAAPANAEETVRDAAVFHIPSNDDDGVARFLEERFGLR
jgi:Cof subfamily protein (haloacid dehalogenase superfamily)